MLRPLLAVDIQYCQYARALTFPELLSSRSRPLSSCVRLVLSRERARVS